MLCVSHAVLVLASVLSISRDSGTSQISPTGSQGSTQGFGYSQSSAQAWDGLVLGTGKGHSSPPPAEQHQGHSWRLGNTSSAGVTTLSQVLRWIRFSCTLWDSHWEKYREKHLNSWETKYSFLLYVLYHLEICIQYHAPHARERFLSPEIFPPTFRWQSDKRSITEEYHWRQEFD